MTATDELAAATRAPRDATDTRPGGPLTGTWQLLRFMLRRDRVRLPAWALGIAVLGGYYAAALPGVYETEEDLRGAVQLFQDPVGRMLTGPGYGFDAPSYERFFANGYGLYFLILAAIMSILLVVRHTRLEEQTGRTELVRANVVGRHAALTAALAVAALTNLAVIAALSIALVAADYPTAGSLLFATATGATGLVFAGLTALTVQVTEYSRAAAGAAGAGLGVAFMLRAGGDMASEGGTFLSWLSPLGWSQQTAPFVLDRWWPLAMCLGFAIVTGAIGFALSARRDVGAGLRPARPGPPVASPRLGTPLGFASRLHQASILGWTAALAVTGLVFGAFTEALLTAFDDMPAALLDVFGGTEDVINGYLSYIALFLSFLAAVFAIVSLQGVRTEETTGRAEPVLATPMSRSTWLGSHVSVITATLLVQLLVAGAATGVGAAIVTGDGSYVWDLTLAHLNQIPAVLTVLALGTLLFGLIPKALPAVWALVAYGMFAGTFGPIMDLPQGVLNLSPFEHAPRFPLEAGALSPLLSLTLLAAVTTALGVVAFRRRGVNVT